MIIILVHDNLCTLYNMKVLPPSRYKELRYAKWKEKILQIETIEYPRISLQTKSTLF